MDAGRSTTSPAAMPAITTSSSARIGSVKDAVVTSPATTRSAIFREVYAPSAELNGATLRVTYADSSSSRGDIVARVCDVCGKRRGIGNNVSHANNRTKRSWEPNLQRVHCIVEK